MTRTGWRLSGAVMICCSAAQLASAQMTLGTGLRASSVDALGRDRWRANQVVASVLRLERPWLTIGSDGAVLRNERGVWRTAGSLEAALLTAAPLGARFAIGGSLGEAARDSALHPSRVVVGTRLSRRVGAGGGWLGADLARSGGARSDNAHFTSGAWRQLGSALVTVSVSSRSGVVWSSFSRTRKDTVFVDSLGAPVPGQATQQDSALASRRWPEAQARLYWAGSRWSVDIAVGGRLATMDVGAAMWASADGALLASRRLAIVGGVGTAPGGMASRLPAHRHASIGVRLMRGAPLSRPLPVELQPIAVAFEVQKLGGSQYRVALCVPRARVVELTGDFTEWKPVALHRGGGDWWETTLPITPGTHQVNIRINGERWVAPPGAAVVDDDFAGVVGIIVVH